MDLNISTERGDSVKSENWEKVKEEVIAVWEDGGVGRVEVKITERRWRMFGGTFKNNKLFKEEGWEYQTREEQRYYLP